MNDPLLTPLNLLYTECIGYNGMKISLEITPSISNRLKIGKQVALSNKVFGHCIYYGSAIVENGILLSLTQ